MSQELFRAFQVVLSRIPCHSKCNCEPDRGCDSIAAVRLLSKMLKVLDGWLQNEHGHAQRLCFTHGAERPDVVSEPGLHIARLVKAFFKQSVQPRLSGRPC